MRRYCVFLAVTWLGLATAPAITINFAGGLLGQTRFRASDGLTDLAIAPGSGGIVVGAFSGPDATGVFTPFLPLSDTAQITAIPPVSPLTPAQIIGTIDDDSFGSPATNGGLAGEQIYLLLSSGGETAIFTSDLAGGAAVGDPWVFPVWTGDPGDDVALNPLDVVRVYDAPGFSGASIRAGTGADAGLTIFSLGAPVTMGVPESGAGFPLLALLFVSLLCAHCWRANGETVAGAR